ncbi:MAG: hypothetical protein U1E76_27110, partial [Planctomycetota bacterium]
TYLLQDGVAGSQERYLLNGATVAGDDPASSNFEFDRLVVSNAFAGGETSATANIQEITDSLSLGAIILRTRSSAAISDTSPPQLTAISPASDTIVGASPAAISLHVEDESATTISSNPPAMWAPSSFPAPSSGDAAASFALEEGPNEVIITATDAQGLSTSVTTSLILDSTAPQVAITSPADAAIIAANAVSVTADVSDATSTDVVSVPAGVSGLVAAGGGELSGVVALEEGANVITVSATDEAGHVGGSSITVVRDTVAPSLSVTTPADGALLSSSPAAVTVSVIDASASTLMIGSHAFAIPAGGGVVADAVTLAEGANLIPITASDAAGNSSSAMLQLLLDLSAPVVTIDTPPSGACFGPASATVPVVATVDDLSATTVSSVPAGVSGSLAAGGGVASGSVPLVNGANTITVQAADGVGRTGQASVVVVLDAAAPLVTLESPADGAAVRGVVEVSASASDAVPGAGVLELELLVDGALIASFAGSLLQSTITRPGSAMGRTPWRCVPSTASATRPRAAAAIVVDNTAPIVTIPVPVDGVRIGRGGVRGTVDRRGLGAGERGDARGR